MAIEQKELYVIEFEDGRGANAVAQSFEEVLKLFGEENIICIRKLPYEEPEKEA